ncbi:MAG: hypothetical protein GY832_21250 [Chloroflexi bacterium]|nr:hypothetical protein [Chloroflexota bacterium]
MNPLSTWTFYRRHKRRATLLLSLICAGTIGLYLLSALALAIFFTPDHTSNMFLQNFSTVVPIDGRELDPTVVSQIRVNPDVAQIIPLKSGLEIEAPNPVRGDTDFYLIGLQEADVHHVLEKNALTLKDGRFLQPRAAEMMLSEKLAAALELQVGDTIDRSVNQELYNDIIEPMQVVGIMAGDVRLVIVPYEYLNNHERYRDRVVSALLVEAQAGREMAVDDFLVNEVQSRQASVDTLQLLQARIANDNQEYYGYGAPLSILLTAVIAVVIGVINQIALAKRLPEFGILHATGHSKKWLIRRLALETSVLAIVGWALGVGLSWLILFVFQSVYFGPNGHDLNPISFPPLVPVIPIPVVVIVFTIFSAKRIFARLDTVAIVERRELSTEKAPSISSKSAKSLPKPLAAATFYQRHRRRAVVLISAMAASIMLVSLLIFNFTITGDAEMAGLNNWKLMSLVRSEVSPMLDPGVVAQIRTYPMVDRVIPTIMLRPLSIAIPPFSDESVYAFGVSAENMAYLVELYNLELAEGHLPRPNTNEIVISQVTAQNRDLQIGDVIGSYDHPVYDDAPVLPAEMVVSGIFARSATPEDENWLSFASIEFLDSHEAYYPDNSMLVVPKAGQKAVMDEWLQNQIASARISTTTYWQEYARSQESTRSTLLTIAVIESVIAIVVAVSLAVLNYIFVSQRQSEFGVLNALGWHRLRLVWRTMRETAFTTTMAWGFSIVLCCIVLFGLQVGVFAPMGLRFNLFNPTPWLSTLPIPIVVLIVTTGTIARTLSELDPVAIIEMR